MEELAQIVMITANQTRPSRQMRRWRSRAAGDAAYCQFASVVGTQLPSANGTLSDLTAQAALKMAEVDLLGLDKQDRRYWRRSSMVFEGGPTGVEGWRRP